RNKNKKNNAKNAGPGQTPENEGGRVEYRANHPGGRTAIKISHIARVYGPRLIIPVKCFQRIGIKDATLDTEVTAPQVYSAHAELERMRKEAKKKRDEDSQVFPPVAIYPGSVPLTGDDEDDMADLMQNMRLEGRTEDRSLIGPGRALVYDSDCDCTPSFVLLRALG
ncbi:hypothetical protein K525DRAFT_210302, partial [Schizophyllum commune Loenen D]